MMLALRGVSTRAFNDLVPTTEAPSERFLDAVARRLPSSAELMTPGELEALWGPPTWRRGLPQSLWVRAGRLAPAEPLPSAGIMIGRAITGDPVFLDAHARSLPWLIVGATGNGKTTFMLSMIGSDLSEGRAVSALDVKGGFAERILRIVPRHRIRDVHILDPADFGLPALSLLPVGDVGKDDYDTYLWISEVIAVFKRMYGESWGPRLERLLRYALLALVCLPGATLADLPRFLRDPLYRRAVLARSRNSDVRSFWCLEFDQWSASQQATAVEPVLNKVGAVLIHPMLRRSIEGQAVPDLGRLVQERAIVIVSAAEGKIGEDGSQLLSGAFEALVQLAAARRAGVPEENLMSCSFYVDEFQRVANNSSFIRLLSESRASRIHPVLATQFLRQVPQDTRAAILGNVGTVVAFCVGEDDAPILARRMGPPVTEWDLLNQDAYQALVKTSLCGRTQEPFTVLTEPIPTGDPSVAEAARAYNRERYGEQHAGRGASSFAETARERHAVERFAPRPRWEIDGDGGAAHDAPRHAVLDDLDEE